MIRGFAIGVLVLLFAGCLGGSNTSHGIESFEDGALLRGVVTDDELRPILGATVKIAEGTRSTTTEADGSFELAAVQPGQWTLQVEAEGHEPANETVRVDEGAAVDLRLQLPRVGVARPYNVPIVLKGHYDCAHEIPIWTHDCMLIVNEITGQNDTVTDETYHYRLPVNAGWESVVLELEWTQAPNNQLDGMRLYLENANGTDAGHSYKVGRADGPDGPLTVVVHRGEPHARADKYTDGKTSAFIPDQGELSQIRVFPRGKLYQHTSQIKDSQGRPLLGIGVGLSIDFVVYATVFYHERAPPGFSAIPDR